MEPQVPPKNTKGAATRRQILETATILMAEKGLDMVSMREIAAQLEIIKPILYYNNVEL